TRIASTALVAQQYATWNLGLYAGPSGEKLGPHHYFAPARRASQSFWVEDQATTEFYLWLRAALSVGGLPPLLTARWLPASCLSRHPGERDGHFNSGLMQRSRFAV